MNVWEINVWRIKSQSPIAPFYADLDSAVHRSVIFVSDKKEGSAGPSMDNRLKPASDFPSPAG